MTERPKAKPSPKVTVGIRIPLELEAMIREHAERDDIPASTFARRLVKRGLAAYDLEHDFLLGEFVERWRGLNETQRHLLIRFADSMLLSPGDITEHPKEAQKIPVLKNPK